MTGGEDEETVEAMQKTLRMLVNAGVVEERGEAVRLSDEFVGRVRGYTEVLRLRDAVKKALTDYLGDIPDEHLKNPYILVSSLIVSVVEDERGLLAAKIVEEELMSAPWLIGDF